MVRDSVTDHDGFELQPLSLRNREATSSCGGEVDEERNEQRERLLAEHPPRTEEEEDDDTGLDIFWSGTAILADFHVVHNLRRQWQDYGSATESAIQTVGFSAEFNALAANRRLTAASARFQRQVGGLG